MAFSNTHNDGRRLVLIVDDQEINRSLLEMILCDEYDLIFAENGQQALEQIRAHRDMLSIVLLDLMMPVMDGFEVLTRLRDDGTLRDLPVIVLTAEKSAELRSLQLGAADFITKPFDMHEVILARVGRIIELSERRQLIQSAETDPLTGLYTGSFFPEYAQQIERFHPDWEMDAVVLNIERFHLVNELHGRDFGDDVLRFIARHIRDFLETTDGIACRMDADIFYVFCRHQESYDAILAKLQSGLDQLTGTVHIRVRLGAYFASDRGIDIERRLERANVACNMLRGNYAKNVFVYNDELHRRELYAEDLINGIYRAVENKEFLVYYQPKYNITGEKPVLCSAEALVRWKHPQYGMVSPGDFIPLFEKNGLIQPVDYFVWEQVAAQIRAWKEQYGVTIPVSINLSRIDMYDPELADKLMTLVRSNGLATAELMLEVTESAYADDTRQIIAVVEHLRSLGFQVEMDDFGSGYSSLNMLSKLPIDALKMDMQFIRNVRTGDSKDFRMVELVLDIAECLSVPVVAEGVETEEQYRLLKDAGCSIIQGYYFSRPVPSGEFERFIASAAKP